MPKLSIKDLLQQSEDGEALDNLKAEAKEDAELCLRRYGECSIVDLDIDMCDVFQSLLDSKMTKQRRMALRTVLWIAYQNNGKHDAISNLIDEHIAKVVEHHVEDVANKRIQ